MEDLLFGLVNNNSLQGIVQKLDPVVRKLENKNTLKLGTLKLVTVTPL
jgi:hypothetical protein